jgi:hypothetical protein
VVTLTLLACAAPAWGLADSISGGSTTLTLDPALYRQLRKQDVELRRIGPTRLDGHELVLPIVSGAFDPLGASGMLTQAGGLKLVRGKRSATLRDIGLNTLEGAMSARLDRMRLRLGVLGEHTEARHGFGVEMTISAIDMTGRAAAGLNRKLGLHGVFRAGRRLGSVSSVTEPERARIVGGGIALEGDAAFFAKLESLEVELEPFSDAAIAAGSSPSLLFPLRGGSLALDLSTGSVFAEAGVRLSQEEGKALMSVLTVGASLESGWLSGSVSASNATGEQKYYDNRIGQLGPASSAQVDPLGRTFAYSGVRVSITQAFADALNETFAKPKGKGAMFGSGEALGTLSIAAQAQ